MSSGFETAVPAIAIIKTSGGRPGFWGDLKLENIFPAGRGPRPV